MNISFDQVHKIIHALNEQDKINLELRAMLRDLREKLAEFHKSGVEICNQLEE